MEWCDLIPQIEPLVVRIYAGDSLGTGFVIGISGQSDQHRHVMIATAWHVAEAAQPVMARLRIFRANGTEWNGLAEVRRIGPESCDTALIVTEVPAGSFVPGDLAPMPLTTMLARGMEVGWLGYPGLVYPELCFFAGVVAGHMEDPPIYLVDGVAINGVSGGPAFSKDGLLVGLVSAYLPNVRGSGEALPGLAIITPINLLRYWCENEFGASTLHRERPVEEAKG